MIKAIRPILLSLVILLFSVTTISLIIINTSVGTHIGLRIAKHYLPGNLSIKHVHGALNRKMVFNNVDYQLNKDHFTAKKVTLKLTLWDLFRGKVQIKNFSADNMVIAIANMTPWKIDYLKGKATLTSDVLQAKVQSEVTTPVQLKNTFSLQGNLNHYEADINLHHSKGTWHARVTGNQEQITLKTLDPTLPEGTLVTTASYDFDSGKWQASAISNEFNPSIFLPDLPGKLNVNITGQGDHSTINAKLKSLTGELSNQQFSADGQINLQDMVLKALSLNIKHEHGVAKIDLDKENPSRINWQIDIPDLTSLSKEIKGDVSAHGTVENILTKPIISGSLRSKQLQFQDLKIAPKATFTAKLDLPKNDNQTPSIQLNAELLPTDILYRYDSTVHRVPSRGGKINALWNKDGLDAKANIEIDNQTQLQAILKTQLKKNQSLTDLNQPLNGNISLKSNNLTFLSSIIPNISSPQGKLNLSIILGGTLASPIYHITSNVKDGMFEITQLKTKVKNIDLQASTKNNIVSFNGSGQMHNGTLNVNGQSNLADPELATVLTLKGKNLLLSNTKSVVINATPDITINLKKNAVNISGNILIPTAKLNDLDLNGTVTLPDDVVFVTNEKQNTTAETPTIVTSNINLKLGDNVQIDASGVKGKLNGNLSIKDTPESATTANGQLSITNGTFEFKGQKLAIQRGHLNFTGGPISNPGIEVRAIREINKLTGFSFDEKPKYVGVQVVGTLDKPQISLFSMPSNFSDADKLSYLLFGQALSSAKSSAENTQMLLSAASALNIGSKGIGLKSQLQRSLGLSELDIVSSETPGKGDDKNPIQHTSLMLGKFLSPKLYVNYSFDILEHTNTFRARYFLNKKWSIQTEASPSGNTGVDILYRIERN